MNEPLKLAIDGRDELLKSLKIIEEGFSDVEENTESLYSSMYGALEDCINNQDQVIELLNLEVSDGRTVGDVMESLIEVNEASERSALKYVAANKKVESYFAAIYGKVPGG